MLHRERDRHLRVRQILLSAFWLLAFISSVSSTVFLDDHFDRISRARQIARYGELPFRDFLDPGYFMTEFSSAGLQLLLGDNLLGDVLLGSIFVATGTTLVAYLSWRVSRSYAIALGAGALALVAFPRGYDFDKVLFYPLAVALCWRYADAPSTRNIWVFAIGAIAAGVFRYDNAVYILAVGAMTVAVVHTGAWLTLQQRAVSLLVATVCLSLPFLAYLQWTAGVVNVADQVVTYGRQEVSGTRISEAPVISLTRLVSLNQLPPPSQRVIIRWRDSADEGTRRNAEMRYTLVEGSPRGEDADHTWSYRIEDASASTLRSLLQDPNVQDTSGIEQDRMTLTAEPWWIRAQRTIPLLRLRLFPGAWHSGNAAALLYYLFHLLPLVAVVVLVLTARSMPLSRAETARVIGVIALCIVLNVLILRNPLGARIGGMIGPSVILAVWVGCRAWQVTQIRARWLLRTATVGVSILAVWSIALSADWEHRLTPALFQPSRVSRLVRTIATSPPDPDLIESRGFSALVDYVRACTRPSDRILATFFAPEIYFFAQRGFAAGLAALSGGHWSEGRFQERSLQLLMSSPAALVIHRPGDMDFGETYPLLSRYLAERYRDVGTTDFLGGQSEERFTVLVRNDRAATSVHPSSSMPCFR